MFKTMWVQANEKIRPLSTENVHMTRCAVTDFKMLVYSRTVKYFGDLWNNYQAQFGSFSEWMEYLNRA